jgi:hypothetical protein
MWREPLTGNTGENSHIHFSLKKPSAATGSSSRGAAFVLQGRWGNFKCLEPRVRTCSSPIAFVR